MAPSRSKVWRSSLVGGNASGDEERGYIVGSGGGQRLSHQIFHDCALERCDEIERELVAVREIVFELRLGDRGQSALRRASTVACMSCVST